MSLDHTEVLCPVCHSNEVNVTGEPIVLHTPSSHGWYGQSHTITIPMQCGCKLDFVHEVIGYKNRVNARTEIPNVPPRDE